MSARDRILRRDEGAPDPPLDSIDRLRNLSSRTHHEYTSVAASLSAAYEATIARQQHTIDVQTAYITKLHAEVDQARMLSGLPPKYAAAPALMSSEVTQ